MQQAKAIEKDCFHENDGQRLRDIHSKGCDREVGRYYFLDEIPREKRKKIFVLVKKLGK